MNSWEASVSALQGFIAKEQVVSSMEIMAGISGELKSVYELFHIASPFYFFTPASSYAFVAFNLFTMPCVASISVIARELCNKKIFGWLIGYQLLLGWSIAVTLHNILRWFI